MYVDDPLDDNPTPIRRKIVVPAVGGGLRVYVEHQPMPFSELTGRDYVDTADLCRIFGCSTRTVYRWINEHGLRPKVKAGRELLFTKADLLRWYAGNRPRPGRPPLDGR